MANNKTGTVDDYIKSFSEEVQILLNKMRETILKAAPNAVEKIAYGIPTYSSRKNLVHFGAFKNHIGFYPTSRGIKTFKEQLAVFECSKGAVKFPYNQPIPFSLVTKIVKYRVKDVDEKDGKNEE